MNRWHSPPAELYTLVEQTPATVLLESASPRAPEPGSAHRADSLTRLFTAPLRVLIANQLTELPALFAEIEIAVTAGLYAAGFFTYECGSFFEPTVAQPHGQPTAQPLAWFGIYQRSHLFDHQAGIFLEGDPPGLANFRSVMSEYDSETAPLPESAIALAEQEYIKQIEAIHEWIRSGDVYQLNFTIPLRVHMPGSPAALYRRLLSRQPAPYAAFLHAQPGRRILSFSPELFFHLESHSGRRRITTRPMKGTASRGRTTREDRFQADWLRNDPKNRSENVMIVDLLRNDLGRLSNFGSVHTQNLFAVERYPTLWQMTSTITGDLRPEVNFQQIFRALFPCGSVTGAPKVRAMQLLAQIERQPRGVYTGALGFFSREQTVFSVAIRTLQLDGERGVMGIGSGIVIDSVPAAEYRECLLKAEFLTRPAEPFSLIESLLWQGDYPLLDSHLDRLEDSADYFAFPFDRAEVKDALLAHAAKLNARHPERPERVEEPAGAPGLDFETWDSATNEQTRKPGAPGLDFETGDSATNERTRKPVAPSSPRHLAERVENHESQLHEPFCKVRLLLNSKGDLQIEDEQISAAVAGTPIRVRIASQRTDPRDPMLFHKTTHRPLYSDALKAATSAGFDEVIFLNLRGEVTEGAISNIFIQKDGRFFTPPIECGLLAGVQRRHILHTQPNVEEKILFLQDLRTADAIYLSNAVRGLRPAVIDWDA